jgi:hypothetical protein
MSLCSRRRYRKQCVMDRNKSFEDSLPIYTDTCYSAMSVSFRDLIVHASGQHTDYQHTISSFLKASTIRMVNYVSIKSKLRMDILRELDSLVLGCEMFLVLGNPGNGCRTLPKLLARRTYDLMVDRKTIFNYQGRLLSPQVNHLPQSSHVPAYGF